MSATALELNRLDLLIGGTRKPALSGAYFLHQSPVAAETSSEVASSTIDDAMDAVAAAHAAQPTWAALSFVERRAILLRAADLLEAELQATTALFALETGGTRPWAAMNVRESAATLREAAGLASAPLGEILPSQSATTTNFSLREPAGVVLAIIPWNAPLILSTRATAIALAIGNTVVLRPSELAPQLAGHVLASALERSGMPPGVVNVVTSAPTDSPSVITAMIDHPHVRRVVFIGSTHVGRSIAATAGAALTPMVAELGGKNSTIIRADVDLDSWIPQLAFAAFANSGQVCMCTDKIIAHSSIADEVAERLATFADAMIVGDPRDASTDLGPAINDRAALRYQELISDATEQGAIVLAGASADGLYLRPTVLRDVTQSCRYFSEEGFVPIVSVISAETDDSALDIANDGDYGLVASILTADAERGESLARRVNAGAVHLNGASVGDEPHVPFGGIAGSGFGRLGGMDSVRFFSEQRTLYRHGVA